MSKTFLYTTDNSTAFIVVHGKDETHAQTVAEQAVSTLPGVTLQARQDVSHSLIVNLSITLLSKAKSDDILIRMIREKFKEREAKIELKNDLRDDGSVQKKILVNERPEIFLTLTRVQADDFEENGFGEDVMGTIFRRLETILRRSAVRPEIVIVEAEGENSGNGAKAAPSSETAALESGSRGARRD